MQIPEHDALIDHATKRNPSGRMTTVGDVASVIVRLSQDGTSWVTGNVIGVDGGEFISG
jgi:NAD(P)-dependent dehydrogenase (short-subunit alcohol dehydrogenase family)